MKAAMQELLENLQQQWDERKSPVKVDGTYFLEKEKQQIIEDFYAGRDDWERKYPDATNYYNQTYNQNK